MPFRRPHRVHGQTNRSNYARWASSYEISKTTPAQDAVRWYRPPPAIPTESTLAEHQREHRYNLPPSWPERNTNGADAGFPLPAGRISHRKPAGERVYPDSQWATVTRRGGILQDDFRFLEGSGGGGIRTREELTPLPVFKTGAFSRSATPPDIVRTGHQIVLGRDLGVIWVIPLALGLIVPSVQARVRG